MQCSALVLQRHSVFAVLAPHSALDPAAFIAQGAEPSCKINVWLFYCCFLAMKQCDKLLGDSCRVEGHICYIFNFPSLMWHVVSPLTVVQGTSVWRMALFSLCCPLAASIAFLHLSSPCRVIYHWTDSHGTRGKSLMEDLCV